jgi:hypothetical protein
MPARTRVFLDLLDEQFAAPRCQAQVAKEKQTRLEWLERRPP